MLTLQLEPADDLAKPLFCNAASCAEWLKQFQLTNLQRAHNQLLTQVNELNRYPMPGLERLDTLELLRSTDADIPLAGGPYPGISVSSRTRIQDPFQPYHSPRLVQTWARGGYPASEQRKATCNNGI